LAHWDEFVEHRREVQTKLEEAFEMASERREAGLRVARLCQSLETKVERLSRQAKEQASKGEVLEDRLSSQAKGMEACREAVEGLRDKFQRNVQDIGGSLVSARAELTEDSERRHQSLQEAMRRGDRCLAEEFFRKLQESGEKLSGNLQVLEDALATFVRQTRVQIADLSEQLEARAKDHVALRGQASELCKFEAHIAALQEEAAALAARADASETSSGEQARLLTTLETKLTKLQDACARFDGRASAAEEALESRSQQVADQFREVSEQTASAIVRARADLADSINSAVASVREDSKEGLRNLESGMSADLQVLRDELRSGVALGQDRLQDVAVELRRDVAEASEASRLNGRELLALIEELQGQFLESRSEARRGLEDVASSTRSEAQAGMDDLKTQLSVLRSDFMEVRMQVKALTDAMPGVDESCLNLRRGLHDSATAAGKAQSTADDAAAEAARLQSFVEAALAELRKDVRASGHQATALERLVTECREELSRQGEAARVESLRSGAAFQKETSELGRRMDVLERSNEDLASKSREQLREASRALNEQLAVVEEKVQRMSEQSDLALLSVRNEVVRVAGAAQDLAPEVEQACRRLIGEEAQMQADKWAQAFHYHKQVASEALTTASAEPRSEVKALSLALSEQEAAMAARFERLAGDVQRQDRAISSRLKHEIEELTVGVEERMAAASATARQAVQEQRQEVLKQLDPVMERLTEVSANMQASRRAEAELGSHFERLLVTTEELCAGQEALSVQGADTAQSLNDLRAEIRTVGNTRDVDVKQVVSPRRRRMQDGSPPPFGLRSHALTDRPGGSLPFSVEPVASRTPEEPVSHEAAQAARSLQSSPDRHGTLSADLPSAFSRLGELRRRLGSPALAAAQAQEILEPIGGSNTASRSLATTTTGFGR